MKTALTRDVLQRLQANYTGYSMPEPTPEAVAERLVAYLRTELGDDRIDFADSPVRLNGGSDTFTYRFRLNGAPPEYCRMMVLRLCSPAHDPARVVEESFIQNALAGQGYPAPRAHFVCKDLSVLGGGFLVMQFRSGERMLDSPTHQIPDMMAHAHAELHRVDPSMVIANMPKSGPAGWRYYLKSELKGLTRLAGRDARIRPAIDWLVANRPAEPANPSICHGDFHPLNILVRNGSVTGVLDWPAFFVADPAADVGSTLMFAIVGRHLLSLPDSDRMAEAYLESYLTRNPVGLDRVRYFQVRRCSIALIHSANGRALWQHPGIVRDLIRTIRRISGVRLPW